MKIKLLNEFIKLTDNYFEKIKDDELFFYGVEAKKIRSQLIGLLNEIKEDINNLLGNHRLIEINSKNHINTLTSALSEDYKKAVYCLNILLSSLKKYRENSKEIIKSKEEILDLIKKGENKYFELKSSLKWDYKNNTTNKDLEKIILKSISAFANGQGGTLIIGVDDEGNILGLEKDYKCLNGTKDEFELHLRNLINEYFGKNFSISNIDVDFFIFDDKEICKVDILKSNKPLFLLEKFYVRNGNSSRDLGIKEITEYLNERFN